VLGATCSRFAGQRSGELEVAASDHVWGGFRDSPLDDARRTMARMAFLSAGERDGQAVARRAKAGSGVVGTSDAPVTLDCALPGSEMGLFPEEDRPGSTPSGPTFANHRQRLLRGASVANSQEVRVGPWSLSNSGVSPPLAAGCTVSPLSR
jgi:hypothetical protein